MVEQHEHLHLLEQHLPMGLAAAQLGQECLEHVPSSEALGTIELVRSCLLQEFHFGEATVQRLSRIGHEA